jgi:hypothetical protein
VSIFSKIKVETKLALKVRGKKIYKWIFKLSKSRHSGLFKVNLVWPFSGLKFEKLENEISVCVRNWGLKTWILKPRFENSDSWLLSKKVIIN